MKLEYGAEFLVELKTFTDSIFNISGDMFRISMSDTCFAHTIFLQYFDKVNRRPPQYI